jgi:hypothetical protein
MCRIAQEVYASRLPPARENPKSVHEGFRLMRAQKAPRGDRHWNGVGVQALGERDLDGIPVLVSTIKAALGHLA